MKTIAVFCGGQDTYPDCYRDLADQVGKFIAQKGYTLIYGAGNTGMMGSLGKAVLKEKGEVIGVIPQGVFHKKEIEENLTELIEVSSLFERKALMIERSDAFLVLPGGIGTLDEFFEVWTLAKLNIHKKPIGILNSYGFFNSLLHLLKFIDEQRFAPPHATSNLFIEETPHKLLNQMEDALSLLAQSYTRNTDAKIL